MGSNSGMVIWPRDARVRLRSDARPAGVPDPLAAARVEAERINANRHLALTARMDHILADSPCERRELLAGIADYHREAMSRVPSATRYPEAQPWVEYTRTYERELCRLANLNDDDIAVLRNLDNYLMFRGFREMGVKRQQLAERCRAAFLPDTDQGPVFIKNAEGDLVIWQPAPPLPPTASSEQFWWDHVDWAIEGAACGMHFDNEPAEIFPLPVFAMAAEHAATTPEVVEFLQRYAPFWGGENILIVDRQLRAMAVEKTSRNYFEAFAPDANGRCYVSGMCCRDYTTPQGKHVADKRNEYCHLFGLPDDVVDRVFWQLCNDLEAMLANALATMRTATPKAQEIYALFSTPYPHGLCLDDYYCHPEQAFGANTVTTYATQLATRQSIRWQRSEDGKSWPEEPEVCRYE